GGAATAGSRLHRRRRLCASACRRSRLGAAAARARRAPGRERPDHQVVSRRARARRGGEARMKRVVVIGGGFAGLHLVRHLEGKVGADEMELTLVDRNNFHLFTPLLYQVATGELPPHAVAYPLRVPLARRGWRFVRAEVQEIDL